MLYRQTSIPHSGRLLAPQRHRQYNQEMSNKVNRKILNYWMILTALSTSTCSNEHSQLANNINLEFELTYQYVVNNKPVEINYLNDFSIFKKNNKDAFTTIAYTWHTISMDACELSNSSQRISDKTSYERMLSKSPTNSNLSKKIIDSDRPCLADIYFDNWANIQNMLLLSYPYIR